MPRFNAKHLLNFGKLKAYLRLDAGVGKTVPPEPGTRQNPDDTASPKSASKAGKSSVEPDTADSNHRMRQSASGGKTGSAKGLPETSVSGKAGPGEEGGVRKVQVGCGPHNIMDDWWNVDIRHFPGIDATLDATKPWPYSGLEYVYGEHFLEHLTLKGALDFMTHAGNSLVEGGVMRLSTPNLTWVMQTHYSLEDAGPEEVISGTFGINRAFHGWGHQFLYSEVMLEYLLAELGFEDVQFCSYGESMVPALTALERHGEYSSYDGSPSVVIVEATRGRQDVAVSDELNSYLTREYLRYVSAEAH